MALSFSDTDLRSISSDILNIPEQITLLGVQKTQALAQQQDALTKDNANAVFYNNFKNIVDRYHTEKRWLNGVQHATYDTANIDSSARQSQGNAHFPTSPVWMGMSPKLIDSINGSPTTASTDFETATFTQMATQITLLKSGFSDGSITAATTTVYSGGATVGVTVGGFAVGKRVVIDSGNKSYFATITAVATGTAPTIQTLTLSVVTAASTTSSLAIGARVRNFHPGFSNAEREGTSTPYAPELMSYWKGLIDPQVTPWQTALTNQQTALSANDATGADAAEIATALSGVSTALSTISSWFGSPATGSGTGKYGDTKLTALEAQRTTRATAAATRITQIDSRLGSVTQNASDGTYSGTGQRLALFKWIDFRISKAGGTLFNYYNFNVVIDFIDKKVIQTNAKKAEFDSQMFVTALTANPDGSKLIKVASATGLAVGNSVKIIDDNSATASTSATITTIDGLNLTLSSAVSKYTTDYAARLVKIL